MDTHQFLDSGSHKGGKKKKKHFSGGGDGLNITINTLKKNKIYGSMANLGVGYLGKSYVLSIFLYIYNTSKSTI